MRLNIYRPRIPEIWNSFIYNIVGIILLTCINQRSFGQDTIIQKDAVHAVRELDIFDMIRKWTNKPAKIPNDTPRAGAKNISLLPIIGYSPANGFVIGAAVSSTEFLGDPKLTRLSTALVNVSLTTKEQILLNLRFDLYTPNNKWYISGDNRLLIFTQPTYGLGVYGLKSESASLNFNGLSTTTGSAYEQPMKFNYIRLYETFLRKINPGWYGGVAVMIDDHFKINDEYLKLDTPGFYLTSHYVYSKKYGFDTAHYSANGLAFQIMHDSRDNPVNPFKGTYFNMNFRFNSTFLGSAKNSAMLYYEWRNYIGLKKDVPRNLIAFWFWGVLTISGHLPYLALPAITWDTYNRSGRGIYPGAGFAEIIYFMEKRNTGLEFQKDGLLGGVAFLNCTTASNPLTGQSVFNSIAPGYGVGLRIKMNKNDRTNIAVDYGRGEGVFHGIYFNIREAF